MSPEAPLTKIRAMRRFTMCNHSSRATELKKLIVGNYWKSLNFLKGKFVSKLFELDAASAEQVAE